MNAAVPGLAAREAAVVVLTRVIDDRRGLDGLLSGAQTLRAVQALDAADAGLVRAILTTALRHRGEIDLVLRHAMDRKPPAKARHLIHTLHIAVAQALFMDVPESAAVNLAITGLRNEPRSQRFAGFANAVLRRVVREGPDKLAAMHPAARAVANMPDWLSRRTRKAYGRDRLAAIATAHMLEPVLDLTVPERATWQQQLGGTPVLRDTLRLDRAGRLEEFPGYDDGAWWVQDAAAALPVRLMGDVRGRSVADLCAAPGGKTAQLVTAGAKVVALEPNANRLARLRANLERLSLDATTVQADLFEWTPDAPLDAVLLDAPCSSLGTIRRHPDVQWTKTEADVAALADMQHAMILRAATFLKPDGMLLFANCSLDRTEGEDVVARILADPQSGLTIDAITADQLPDLPEAVTRQGTVRTLPHHLANEADPRLGGLDGFFAARFLRAH